METTTVKKSATSVGAVVIGFLKTAIPVAIGVYGGMMLVEYTHKVANSQPKA